jgi:hypothetical protein
MISELISRRTRNAFREYLVAWTKAEIRMLFDEAGIQPDLAHNPVETGERRRFVEQHYRAIDFAQPAAARRVVSAFVEVLRRALAESDNAASAKRLLQVLAADGYLYRDGTLRPTSPAARLVLNHDDPKRTISEITRRSIVGELQRVPGGWSGHLAEGEFLARLYDLTAKPSLDSRFDSMDGDIWQHRENNRDWPDDWVFFDERLGLLSAPDDVFLQFICETLDPAARPSIGEGETIASLLNEHLRHDGWSLSPARRVSNRATFVARRSTAAVDLPPVAVEDILSDTYVRELSEKCDARLSSGDLDGAVTVARTLLEAVLGELEVRLVGQRRDHRGDLQKQFKAVARLLHMDDERPELDQRYKDVVRGLVTVVNGLAPLRNRISDGHARTRRPAAHHVRIVVNASKTVSTFLVESYSYQADRSRSKPIEVD